MLRCDAHLPRREETQCTLHSPAVFAGMTYFGKLPTEGYYGMGLGILGYIAVAGIFWEVVK